MPEETTTEARVIAILSRMEERQEAGFEQINQRVDTLREDVQAWRQETHGRLSRLEGGFEQMDKRIGSLSEHTDKRLSDLNARISNVEALQRWAIGVMITSWLTLVGLTVTVLLKLP